MQSLVPLLAVPISAKSILTWIFSLIIVVFSLLELRKRQVRQALREVRRRSRIVDTDETTNEAEFFTTA